MLDYKQIETIEKKINSQLKNLFYVCDCCLDDKQEAVAYSIVLNALEGMGFDLKTDRKNENIIKLENWHNGTRHHVYIKKEDLNSVDDFSTVPYRKSINYKSLLEQCNFDGDEVVRTWYILVV